MASTTSQADSSWRRNNEASQSQRTAEARAAFEASLKSAGADLDKDFQSQAKGIHANAKRLDEQDKKVQTGTKSLSKEADALDKFLAKQKKNMPSADGLEADIAKVEADLDMLDGLLDDMDADEIETGNVVTGAEEHPEGGQGH